MAEGYIVRRGGSGISDDIAIYTGTTAPTNKPYGIWANTSNAIQKIYLTNTAFGEFKYIIKWEGLEASWVYGTCPICFIGEGNNLYAYSPGGFLRRTNINTNIWTTIGSGSNYSNTVNLCGPMLLGDNIYAKCTRRSYNVSPINTFTYFDSINKNTGVSTNIYASDVSRPNNFPPDVQRGVQGGNLLYWSNGGATIAASTTSYATSTIYNGGNSGAILNNMSYFNGNLYCLQGYRSDSYGSYGNAKGFLRIDAANGVSTRIADFPIELAYADCGGVYYGGKIFYNSHGKCYIYNIASNIFTSVDGGISTPSHGIYAANCNKYIYFWSSGSHFTGEVYSANEYPNGTLIINNSGSVNPSTILSQNNLKINETVQGIYYSNGNSLTKLSGKVRVEGSSWQDIT